MSKKGLKIPIMQINGKISLILFIHFPNLMSPRLKIIKGYIIIPTRPVTLYFGKEVTIQTYKTVTNSFASACMLFRKLSSPA